MSSMEEYKASCRARLEVLKKKRLESVKLNRLAVLEEERLNSIPKSREQKLRRLEKQQEEEEKKKEAEEKGIDYDRERLLTVGADEAERWERKKRKANTDEGFSTYEAASKRQYDRVTKSLKVDHDRYEKDRQRMGDRAFYCEPGTINIGLHKDRPEDLEKLAQSVEKQIEKREKYSRRRTHNDDDDINYINERNMRFNKKLERFYGEYTQEIKQNLERGTAV